MGGDQLLITGATFERWWRVQSTNCRKAATLHSIPGLRQPHMSHRKNEPPPLDNAISDQTGQFDLRFVLWRHFCKQNNIPVETLPSQLNDNQKELWEELKATRLRGQ
jgi:hypothetical protein